MVWGHRIHRPHHVVGLGLHDVARLAVGRNHEQGTDAITIQPEVLGARVGNDHLGHASGEFANQECVSIQVRRETLVGNVDEGQQFALDDNVGNGSPLRLVRVDPGRVVTACMEEDDVAFRYIAQCVQHPAEVQRFALLVVVRVGLQFQARAAQQGDVICPGRAAYPDCRIRSRPQDDACSHTQRSRAARRLEHRYAIVCNRAGECQIPHRFVEIRRPRRANVGLGCLNIEQALLGPFDHVEYGGFSRRVPVHPDPEVHFRFTRIASIFGNETDDGIGRQQL